MDEKRLWWLAAWQLTLTAAACRPDGYPFESTLVSPAGIAYETAAGPRGDLPVVLIHAGIADRQMWDPQWSALTAVRDEVRLDLRGFGESTERPPGQLSPVDDVLDT